MIPIQNVTLYMPTFQAKEEAVVNNYSSSPNKNIVQDKNVSHGADLLSMQYNVFINKPSKSSVSIKTSDMDFQQYKELGANAVEDISARAGKKGQFLNWIGVLPETQLKNIDTLYNMAETAKQGKYTDLAVLGIGGSRHTTEAMMNMLGKSSNIHFYSGIDPKSFSRFMDSIDLDKTQFLVVSKSGKTLETTVAYQNVKKVLQEKLGREDVSDRFIAMTDISPEKSNLRREVESGAIKLSGQVHDDVGGRFSIFDDATIFTMAYAGVSKDDVKRMLKASLAAQKEFLNSDINKNDALKLAAFNVDSRLQGKTKHFVEYFGDDFSGATLWEKQMKNESLKSKISTDTNIGPGYLHYNAESDLDDDNNDSFYTFVYVAPQDKSTSSLLNGAMKAYKELHPVNEIIFNELSPEAIARFIELKHFETLYTGNMLRQKAGETVDLNKPMPEVIQPNVEKYKKNVYTK